MVEEEEVKEEEKPEEAPAEEPVEEPVEEPADEAPPADEEYEPPLFNGTAPKSVLKN